MSLNDGHSLDECGASPSALDESREPRGERSGVATMRRAKMSKRGARVSEGDETRRAQRK